MNFVSVIIPAYNASEFICDAIESVILQAYKKCEIIIVDDGSTDVTQNVLKRYIDTKVIQYVYQPNSGPGAARNKGLANASGKYICFLDADDEMVEGSLLKRVQFLDKYQDAGMVFTDFYKINSPDDCRLHFKENNFLSKFNQAIILNSHDEYLFGEKFFQCALEYNPFILTSTVMIRTEVVQRIGTFRTNLMAAEDVDYWLRVCRLYSVGFLNEPLTKYNNYRSVLTKNTESYFEDSIVFYTNLLEDVKRNKNYKKLLKKKISILEFNYGYHLFHQKQFSSAKSHFRKSFIYNKMHMKAIKWNLLSLFPNVIIAIKNNVK